MLEGINRIKENASVSEIVAADYRTAAVFKKHNINFCCGERLPLNTICNENGLELPELILELEFVTQSAAPHTVHDYQNWSPDFLADYIVHVHHRYLDRAIPETAGYLEHLTQKHSDRSTFLEELRQLYNTLTEIVMPRLHQEEEIIFPYIRQITRAYLNRESYAALLVRTLRKPVEQVMHQEQKIVGTLIRQIRDLTHNYTPPENTCITFTVAFQKLLELDNDIVHHLHLEHNILYPRVLQMESELVNQKE